MACVLIIDDNKDITFTVKKMLERASNSYSVQCANSGEEGLNYLKKNKVDIILLDIMMPGMDGWKVCEKIKSKKETEKIPIIFLSAKTDPVSKTMGKLAAVDYIEKPIDADYLSKKIQTTLKA